MRDLFKHVARTAPLPRAQRRAIRAHWRAGKFGNIFPAGSSAGPQLLVGRETHIARLNALGNELLRNRVDEEARIIGVALHGPRGTGKTVLLSAFRRALTHHHGGAAAVVVLSGESVPADPRELTELVLAKAPARGGAWGVVLEASTEMPGLAKVKAGVQRTPAAGAASLDVAGALAAHAAGTGGKPVLVAMDEAHAAPPEALGALLNAAQSLNGDGVPVAVVLAGTPDLATALDEAGATWFMDRATAERLVPVGNIAAADCAATVAAPLDALGLEFDRAALAAAAEWCRGSPYFSQAFGLAALESAGGGRVDFAAGGDVEEGFRAQAENRYSRAWSPLERRGMTACARQLGALWRWAGAAPGRRVSRHEVDAAVRSGLRHPPSPEGARPEAAHALAYFEHLGLLWRPSGDGDDAWELGLPSFFDYVEAQFQDPRNYAAHAVVSALDADLREKVLPRSGGSPPPP